MQDACDFIRSHHGTTVTSYFYNQYLQAGGDPAASAEKAQATIDSILK